MIDEYWTWIFYGYHSDELSRMSGKPVVAVCDECYRYRVLGMDGYTDLCLSCARAAMVGEHSPTWKGGKVSIKCDNCGHPIERYQHRLDVREHNFCCKRCYTEFRVGKPSANRGRVHSEETRRKSSASRQGISYDEWEGFAKDRPYCPAFDETCRESNRDKYDRKCFVCGKDESENITSTGKHIKLAVHHVDMNKGQGCDNHEWKLVPLCLHHHGSAHTNLVMNRIIYLLNNVWNKVI